MDTTLFLALLFSFLIAAVLQYFFPALRANFRLGFACPGITDILVRESGRISRDIYDRNFATDPWNHLVKRGAWPEGEGEIISNLTYERKAPTDANPTWSAVTVLDGSEGGACLPEATAVSVGSTTRTYGLKRTALEGPDFCAEEARSVFALGKQLDSIINVLSGYTAQMWRIRHNQEYSRLVRRKVAVIAAGLLETNDGTEDYSGVDASTSDAMLSQGVLDKYKLKLIRDGAGQSAMGQLDGGPVLTLMIGAEASDYVLKGDDDARDDMRWGKPNELLRQIGVERSYRGFFHVINPYPRRFTWSGGAYTEIAAFADTSATKGTKSDVNSAWEAATHEEALIFDPTVMTALIPEPIVSPHSKFKFDPINYMGLWSLKNILNRTCNPDGNIVYHRGILASGSEPVHPERGVGFIFKRCDAALNLITSCP